jgi:hypothetical protein
MTDPVPSGLVGRLRQILDDMRGASAAVDDSAGTSDYTARLVALALISRHFLREMENDQLEALLRSFVRDDDLARIGQPVKASTPQHASANEGES